MSDVVFKPFDIQKKIILDKSRIIGAFAGKRSGKTEVGAIKSIMYQEHKTNYDNSSIDPFIGCIVAPTTDMLRRLSLKKFMAYAKPFIKNFNKSTNEITWHDGSIIYGLSADRPERIEGIKAHWIWLDEILQMKEQMFLECRARTSDTQGNILATGSLGTNFINPKSHWAYTHFKEDPSNTTSTYEWPTIDNPYFPKEEIESLKDTLDPLTFRQLFELDWDTLPKNAVYDEFSDANIIDNYVYNEKFETYISIDWGWAHPMAVGFFQYDRQRDIVYLFDEIIQSRIKIFDNELWDKIMNVISRHGIKDITNWVCDIAGDQEREQFGKSNVKWFAENKNIKFKKKRHRILKGIPVVRKYIKSGLGNNSFFIDKRCPKSIDGCKRYSYAEKDGLIQNENPVKKDDDAVDMIRYFFINILFDVSKSSSSLNL